MKRSKKRRLLWALFPVMGALLLSSCSNKPSLYPVRGKVLLDGVPTEASLIIFYPATKQEGVHPSRGLIQPDGSYTLSTFKLNDGAPPGDYTVAVTSDGDKFLELKESGKKAVDVPGIYASPVTSPLKAAVKQEANELPTFELTAKKK